MSLFRYKLISTLVPLLGTGVFCVLLRGSMLERGYMTDFNSEYFVKFKLGG